MLTTRALIPSCVSFSYASTHSETSLPVPIRITSGLPPGGVGQNIRAARHAQTPDAYLVRSSVGMFCRERIRHTGSWLQLHDHSPRLRHLIGIARTHHDQARNRPQRNQLLHRLMRRPVFADADGIVREDDK